MPFVSEAQRRAIYAMERRGQVPPGTAATFEAETPDGPLPERLHPPNVLIAPKAVRAMLRRGLKLLDYRGRGLQDDTVAWARRLVAGEKIDLAKAHDMHGWFARHGPPEDEAAARARDEKTPAAVAWMLWGGDPSIPWREKGWRDPVAAWNRAVLAHFAAKHKRQDARREEARLNDGTAGLILTSAVGLGTVAALGRGFLRERESKRLDATLLRALAPFGLPAEARLAPSGDGPAAPRLRDLADPHTYSVAYDARKRELLTQVARRAVDVSTDARGIPYLTAPGEVGYAFEPSRRYEVKFNDIARAKGVWASAQWNDPLYGSWGIVVRTGNGADLYHYTRARTWELVGRGTWNLARGRAEGFSVAPTVIEGVSAAILAQPGANLARTALVNTIEGAVAWGFRGSWDALPELPSAAAVPVSAVASARCLKGKVERMRGTKSRARGRADLEQAEAVALAALGEVCGLDGRMVPHGSPCDVALSTLESAGPDVPCSIQPTLCPHRVAPATLSEWRAGAMPPIGPYETDRPHAIGDDPCCFYHPTTQARWKLRAEVEARLQAPRGSDAWRAAVEAAEAAHPLYAAWMRCDTAARKRVGAYLEQGAGSGIEGTMKLLRGFYDAVSRGEGDAARVLYGRLQDAIGLRADYDSFAALDAEFWDVAHREAHDTRNPGYLKWVHDAMQKRGVPYYD